MTKRKQLDELLKAFRKLPAMTPEALEAQRRSFVIGQLGCMAAHKDKSTEELAALYDSITNKES